MDPTPEARYELFDAVTTAARLQSEAIEDMLSTPPGAGPGMTKLGALAWFLDEFDRQRGVTTETDMQDDVRAWEAKLLEAHRLVFEAVRS